MADQVTLLDFWPSLFGMRVRIALAEKGIDYEAREENLSDKSALLLKMSPVSKKIPVVIHNGKPIWESLIIVQYIDEVWKEKTPLLPCDPYQRAQARFWADFVDNKLYTIARQVWLNTTDDQEATKNELIECFKLLEGELGDKAYFGGEILGLVDVALIPFYTWFNLFEQFGKLNMKAECPKIVSWAHRCMEMESVSKSLPDQDKCNDFLVGFRKKLAAN